MKKKLKDLLARHGFYLSRTPPNRFYAMTEALSTLQRCGYNPVVIIDAGANFGQWATVARKVFPKAVFHLVEPQPVCHETLRSFGTIYPVVLTEPDVPQVRMTFEFPGSPGATVQSTGEVFPATTLDQLFSSRVSLSDRVLLKLDLEDHEPEALSGASKLLESVEVVVSEVGFKGIGTFSRVYDFLRENGFQLFDFASMSAPLADRRLNQADCIFVSRESPLMEIELFKK